MIRVLHVEDSPVDAALAQAALGREAGGFSIVHVGTLAEAMAQLQGARGAAYDVVLADMLLPDGDGLQLFAQARARGWPVALIAVTAAGDDRRVFSALKAGADDYVAKRGDYLARLPRLLRSALERHRRNAAVRRKPIRVAFLGEDPAAAAADVDALVAKAPYLACQVVSPAADSPQRLAAMAQTGGFDVLVLDVEVHASEVLDIIKELREASPFEPAAVIIARAHDEEFAVAAMRMGVSEYLVKAPEWAEQLPASIEQVHARAELARLNAELERRVSERTSELNAVIRELESFAQSIAHDLRAPARAVSGFARVLAEELGAGAPLECARILQRIERNANVMHDLIDEVLEVGRAATAPLERQPTDLTALVRECIDLIPEKPRSRFIVAALGEARVDRASFRQVFANLLGNAVKFTRQRTEPRIELGREERDGESVWFVRDNGVGFDMSRAAALFRMFQRLHRREEFEGSGVGLASVARIVERHGGRVWAEAEPGKGATFYFTIGR